MAPQNLVSVAYRPAAEPPAALAPPMDPGIMPDLQGRSAREAAISATRQGLVVELSGSGRVIGQDPAAGTVIEAGNTCRLTLSRSGGRP